LAYVGNNYCNRSNKKCRFKPHLPAWTGAVFRDDFLLSIFGHFCNTLCRFVKCPE